MRPIVATSSARHVLQALREVGDGHCSGEELSLRLGVSRAQIWKHVDALRRRGYTIDGEPGEGYRLLSCPDRLYPEEIQNGLHTRWLAREVDHFEEIDSTNREALERARQGVPNGTAVIAEAQSAGRGRLGRRFYSPAHLNLYTSIVLRPALSIAETPTLILAAAVAVADAVAQSLESEDDVEIKWPNDVLLGGKKTSGILMETVAEGARIAWAVLGIGVNLNAERETFPEEFRELATSLRSHSGRVVDRVAFTRTLFELLEEVLDGHAKAGFAAVRPRFEARFRMRGRRVGVLDMHGGRRFGSVEGIAADGALELRCENGQIERVLAGDVTLAKDGDPSEGGEQT